MPYARHCLILLALLATGLALLGVLVPQRSEVVARWPESDLLFQVDGWTVGPEQVDVNADGVAGAVLLQRTYAGPGGARAELVVWSTAEPQGKQLFRRGPDRDYLGAGYVTEPAPAGLVPPMPGGGALIARQGAQAWLLLYALGERRGALGSGPRAWLFAELDALLDQPNHYFLARIGVPFRADEPPPAADASGLAGTLFPRLTDWYANLDA
jgi:hypothetical protein